MDKRYVKMVEEIKQVLKISPSKKGATGNTNSIVINPEISGPGAIQQ